MSAPRPRFAFPISRLGGLSLSRQFWIALSLAMVCSLALGIGLIARYQEQRATSQANLHRLADFRLALAVANRISAERGPTNRVLGEEAGAAAAASRGLLLDARAATNAALAQAAATPALAASVPLIPDMVDRARQQADALAAKPLSARSTAELARSVGAMFAAYDAAEPLVESGMTVLLRARTDLVGRALVMQMLSELRDYAGRLGSYLVVPMIHGEPMDPARRAAYAQARGRVLELWSLVSQLTATDPDPAVVRAHRAVASRFLGTGMALLQSVLEQSATGHYAMTATAFTAAIVPTFTPLEQLRDAFIASTIAELQSDAAAARRSLIKVALATLLALLLELWLLLASQRLVFHPLLKARRRIVDLADGQLDVTTDDPRLGGEIRELYRALASLREKLIERAALTERLRLQAETDGLTGVFNRRALDGLAEGLTRSGDGSQRLGIIMLDIDHFKRVNDSWGHSVGDEVLKETAHRLRVTLRTEDILARFGGEEFVVLLADEGRDAYEVAERLRLALQDSPFPLSSGQRLQVTASFGIAVALLRPGIWPELIAAADHALYRAKETGRNRVVMQTLEVV